MAVRMLVSVVSAMARRAGRSTVRRDTNSATRCCESAAEPPLPQTMSLLAGPSWRAAVMRPASTTAWWMASSCEDAGHGVDGLLKLAADEVFHVRLRCGSV